MFNHLELGLGTAVASGSNTGVAEIRVGELLISSETQRVGLTGTRTGVGIIEPYKTGLVN